MSEQYGPKLPAKLKPIGPILPPELEKASGSKIIGPALPPHFVKSNEEEKSESTSEEEEEEICGPLPPGVSGNTPTQRALNERALQLKLGYLDGGEKKQDREEWMLELPQAQSRNLGLGPRQFRKNAAPDMSDRSSWTDTPEQKANKKTEPKIDLKKEAAKEARHARDKEQEKLAKKHNKLKKRDSSLMELHQEERKRKKKEDQEDKPTRRPFNRETDLNVNRFDDAQKSAILKKAALLDDRFSKGESKFL